MSDLTEQLAEIKAQAEAVLNDSFDVTFHGGAAGVEVARFINQKLQGYHSVASEAPRLIAALEAGEQHKLRIVNWDYECSCGYQRVSTAGDEVKTWVEHFNDHRTAMVAAALAGES